MAKNTGPKKTEAELKSEIVHSRAVVARELSGLSYEADIPAKIRRSIRGQTAVWVAGAMAVGLVVTLIPRKKKIVVQAKTAEQSKKKLIEGGLALGLLKIALGFARPAIMKIIQQKMSGGPPSRGPRSW